MEVLNTIKELEKIYQTLLPLTLENQKRLDTKFRLEFNYNTNHIEGNTITYSETELLLIFDSVKGDHTLRELEEMKGGDIALSLIKELASDHERPLTEQSIKNLNEILLVRPFWKDAITQDGQTTRRLIKVGDYKEHPNSVRLQNGEIFDYTSPIDTPNKMKELIDWYRKEEESKEIDPIVLAAMLHYKFVLIHPFDDGNGRISRLLMNYVLHKNNLPPVIIKTSDKRNYLSALNKADTGDVKSFIKYIAEQLIWSLEISIKAAKSENIDERGDLDKKIKLLKQKLNSSEKKALTVISKEVLIDTLSNNIEPLLLKISSKISEFDSLFKSKKIALLVEGKALGSDLVSSLEHLYKLLNLSQPSLIQFFYTLSNFRKGINIFNVDCVIEIQFHENAYEISSPIGLFNYSKFYHERITDNEIELIIEHIGTYIHDQIDRQITN